MSALNTAVKRRLLQLNPASYVELDTDRRPKAVVWTEQRKAHWRATGERPKVAVWVPSQTGGVPRPCRGPPALCPAAPDRLPRSAPRRGRRAAVDRGRSRAGDAHRQPADPAARRAPRDRRTQERERRADRRAGLRHRRRPAAAPRPPARGEAAVGSRLDRHRPGVHRGGRQRAGARPRLPAVRPPAQGGRPAAGPLARPAPQGRNPGTGRRREPEGGLGDARPLHHRDHRRHLHQRAARGCPGSRRSGGPAGAPADVGRTSRPHFGPIWRSTTATRGFAGDETAAQRRAWDSNPRNESPRSAVFKDADRKIITQAKTQKPRSAGVRSSAAVRRSAPPCHCEWHANGTPTMHGHGFHVSLWALPSALTNTTWTPAATRPRRVR
jgi:hypothetical protein